jgi:hypothetical protein
MLRMANKSIQRVKDNQVLGGQMSLLKADYGYYRSAVTGSLAYTPTTRTTPYCTHHSNGIVRTTQGLSPLGAQFM